MKDQFIDRLPEENKAFAALPRDVPFNMLNMLSFREKAKYPKGHEFANKGLTGAEAYAIYADHTTELLKTIDAKIIYSGIYKNTLIGPPDLKWDAIFIVQYPSANAFIKMTESKAYLDIVDHRQSSIKTSRLIRISPNIKAKDGSSPVFPSDYF